MTIALGSAISASSDRWRPQFHIAAVQGLINDPNGLIHWRGQTHVFYQWNPQGCTHANKAWAHVVSDDLVTWRRLPVALSPTDRFDSHGCYSGSAVAKGDDLVLVYTGNVRNAAGARETYQCLARSTDGVAFQKLGPVIDGPFPGYTTHFRDPKVWREGGVWWMVLGVQTEREEGTVLLLRGAELTQWELVGELLTPGDHGYMCECPDLFPLDGQSVMLLCEQREGSNLAGWLAGTHRPGTAEFAHGPFQRLDHGRDFYAPQTFDHADGRRIMIGWMGLPEQADAPTVAFGWFHCLTLPRELRMVDGRLCQQPVRELAALRGVGQQAEALTIAGPTTLPGVTGDSWDLELDGLSGDLTLHLLAGDGAAAELRLTSETLTLTGRDGAEVDILGEARLAPGDGTRLRILADRSSLEIFAGDGAVVISARFYPRATAPGITFDSATGAQIGRLSFWPMTQAIAD